MQNMQNSPYTGACRNSGEWTSGRELQGAFYPPGPLNFPLTMGAPPEGRRATRRGTPLQAYYRGL